MTPRLIPSLVAVTGGRATVVMMTRGRAMIPVGISHGRGCRHQCCDRRNTGGQSGELHNISIICPSLNPPAAVRLHMQTFVQRSVARRPTLSRNKVQHDERMLRV
jgi:hypothetical protein